MSRRKCDVFLGHLVQSRRAFQTSKWTFRVVIKISNGLFAVSLKCFEQKCLEMFIWKLYQANRAALHTRNSWRITKIRIYEVLLSIDTRCKNLAVSQNSEAWSWTGPWNRSADWDPKSGRSYGLRFIWPSYCWQKRQRRKALNGERCRDLMLSQTKVKD